MNNYSYQDLPRLMTLMTGDEKHTASATSTLDILWVLYDSVLNINPVEPRDANRDRFLLSKGHGPMAYYAVLAAKGFIEESSLSTFGLHDSILGQHPDNTLIPGVEISSGSLGHGLPIAVGVAHALRAKGINDARVFCLVGDAELDEGSNSEAIILASRLKLENLTAIVVDNGSSSHGWPGGIGERFKVEGWTAAEISGRDHEALERQLSIRDSHTPRVVVAQVEGKE